MWIDTNTPRGCRPNSSQIIIEVNAAMPSFEGLHDITMTDLPPRRKPYLIMAPEDRIGTPYIPIDTEKVVAIVESDYPDQTQDNAPEDDTSRAIANNLIEFLKHEVDSGRLPTNLLPIQSGIGNIANAVIGGLAHGNNFDRLKVWTEVLQDSKSPNLSFVPIIISQVPICKVGTVRAHMDTLTLWWTFVSHSLARNDLLDPWFSGLMTERNSDKRIYRRNDHT